MDELTCKSCQHFRQHYSLDDQKLFRVFCGHCTLSPTRHKRPYAKICDCYLPGNADTDAFVTKEYLSKVLLEYALKLELLPEITDAAHPSKK